MLKRSEIRHDLISGNWVIIAPKRGSRPNDFKNKPRKEISKNKCPFEGTLAGQEIVKLYGAGKDWRFAVMKNKYPAVVHGTGPMVKKKSGIYEILKGFGHHELVATRDHDKNFPRISKDEAINLFWVLRDRYQILKKEKEVAYVSIFHNWGVKAGASIYHPHYQIVAVPIVPRSVEISLLNSERYFRKTGRCMHDFVVAHELRDKKRIIFKNKNAVVVAPYVSREPFQLRVYPLKHRPYFEETPDNELKDIALALRTALLKLEKKLNKPDYNFYIHTAPAKNAKSYGHYHWHIEIVPQSNVSAGFELGTGIEINTVDPDDAARILRSK
ncbi:MAG: DUF4931 domain-containing protein [Minisyncoccia bacterium]